LINKKIINAEFRNVKPKTLKRLETFFIERIDRCIESHRINQAYNEKVKEIEEQFEKRIAELKDKIK